MVYSFYVAVYICLTSGVVALIGGAIYDLQSAVQAHHLQVRPYASQLRQRPLVSILVAAHNNQATIQSCLKSITANTYRKYQIVIINNASSDTTKKLAQTYITNHPNKDIKLLSKRQYVLYKQALLDGFKRADGELIIILKATDRLSKNFISAMVKAFISSPTIDALTPNIIVDEYPSLLALGQQFAVQAQAQFKKLSSLVHFQQSQFNSGDAFRTEVFKRYVTYQGILKTKFNADAIVHYSPSTYKWRVTEQTNNKLPVTNVLFLIIFCMAAFAASYSLYLAFILNIVFFFALIWVAVSIFLLFAVWNSPLKIIQKVKLFLLLPISPYVLGLTLSIEFLRRFMNRIRLIINHTLYQFVSRFSSIKTTV